jgi:NADH dehydrogenase
MSRFAVIGASGLVGRRLVNALTENGHQVRGLSRSGWIGAPAGAEIMRGDMSDGATVRSALEGAQAAVLLAPGLGQDRESARAIVSGTRRVVEDAQAVGVRKIVALSCLGAHAASTSPLYAARWQADRLIGASGLSHIILRPSLILGRDDGVSRPLAYLIRRWPIVPLPGRADERMQPIDADDVARCIVTALSDEAQAEEVVSIGGPEFLTLRQLVDLIGAQLGVSRAKLLVPAGLEARVARLLPVPARGLFSPARVAQFRQDVVASPGIVEREFGFQPVSVLDRLPDYLG